VWIVDPLDGTREFLAGIPEWSISIGYVEDGTPVAGGICNPQTGESVVGGLGHGVVLNGEAVVARSRHTLDGALVLASRSEFRRGEWSEFKNMPFEVRPVGSVAYKLACVAGGLADATWTLQPKNEWDVAAGVALIRAVGGVAYTPSGESPTFNNRDTLMTGLIAHSDSLTAAVRSTLGIG
jgi:myo-inositol-1(or 4)-monophosphatase